MGMIAAAGLRGSRGFDRGSFGGNNLVCALRFLCDRTLTSRPTGWLEGRLSAPVAQLLDTSARHSSRPMLNYTAASNTESDASMSSSSNTLRNGVGCAHTVFANTRARASVRMLAWVLARASLGFGGFSSYPALADKREAGGQGGRGFGGLAEDRVKGGRVKRGMGEGGASWPWPSTGGKGLRRGERGNGCGYVKEQAREPQQYSQEAAGRNPNITHCRNGHEHVLFACVATRRNIMGNTLQWLPFTINFHCNAARHMKP